MKDRKREARKLSDRAGTIAQKASALAMLMRDAGHQDHARDMATIAQKAAEIDGILYRESQ